MYSNSTHRSSGALSRPAIVALGIVVTVLLLTGAHHHETIKSAWVGGQGSSYDFASTSDKPMIPDKVVCFGDSLSDAGNGAWEVTNHTWPTNPKYFGHRFSNGPVHSEYVAQELQVPLVSYATGGASVSTRISSKSGPKGDWPVDCILEQISKYSVGKTDESNTVFIVYAGANDAYFHLQEGGTPDEVVEDIQIAISMLRKIGGRMFIVPTLPPLGEAYPYANALPAAAGPMGAFSKTLRGLLFQWAKTDPNVAVADFYKLYEEIMGNPAKHGFNPAKLKIGCINDYCLNPQEYIWFDDFHPTTVVHKLLGDVSLKALNSITNPLKKRFTRER